MSRSFYLKTGDTGPPTGRKRAGLCLLSSALMTTQTWTLEKTNICSIKVHDSTRDSHFLWRGLSYSPAPSGQRSLIERQHLKRFSHRKLVFERGVKEAIFVTL